MFFNSKERALAKADKVCEKVDRLNSLMEAGLVSDDEAEKQYVEIMKNWPKKIKGEPIFLGRPLYK